MNVNGYMRELEYKTWIKIKILLNMNEYKDLISHHYASHTPKQAATLVSDRDHFLGWPFLSVPNTIFIAFLTRPEYKQLHAQDSSHRSQ